MKLTDLYDEGQLTNEEELLFNFVDEDNLEQDFTVSTMEHAGLSKLLASDGASSVIAVYNDHATAVQRAIVGDNVKRFDEDRVVVVSGSYLIDGFHHVVAAHKLGLDVKFIDLSEDPSLGMKP
jgi:hypothetical protein